MLELQRDGGRSFHYDVLRVRSLPDHLRSHTTRSHRERGERACVRLATHPASSKRAALEEAFGRRPDEVARAWREHLERLATPAPAVSPAL